MTTAVGSKTLRNTLYELRKRRKISQLYLAKKCGFSLYRLGTIERGEKVPSLTEALILADFFGEDLDRVFTIT